MCSFVVCALACLWTWCVLLLLACVFFGRASFERCTAQGLSFRTIGASHGGQSRAGGALTALSRTGWHLKFLRFSPLRSLWKGNCLLFPTPVVLGGLEVLLPMGALGDISTFFCVFSQASLFSFFGLPVHRGDNSGSFSCRSVMFAFLGGPHYCSVLLLCPCCIHLGWYLTSLHSFLLTGC